MRGTGDPRCDPDAPDCLKGAVCGLHACLTLVRAGDPLACPGCYSNSSAPVNASVNIADNSDDDATRRQLQP